MHFKKYILLTSITCIALCLFSCDNTEIEPKLKEISTTPIDSEYAHLQLQYAFTSDIRYLKLIKYTSSYDLFDYTHNFEFDDGSTMTLKTTYDFRFNNSYNLISGNSISGYQGYYACMDFYDKLKNEHYAFKTQTAGITINNVYYNSIYYVVNFNNNYTTWPGYTTTKAIFSGKLAVRP